MAIEHGSVSSADLSGVVHDDDLGVERLGLLGWVVLGVGADGATTDVLQMYAINIVISLLLNAYKLI